MPHNLTDFKDFVYRCHDHIYFVLKLHLTNLYQFSLAYIQVNLVEKILWRSDKVKIPFLRVPMGLAVN